MSEQAIEFTNPETATAFSLLHYEEFANTVNNRDRQLIGMIQASGIRPGDGRDDCIVAIQKCLNMCPEVPYDIVAWRGGEMNILDRPFVSASFLKNSARRYCAENEQKLHRFIIHKGAKIFPLRALHKDYGDGEAEIIIDTKCLINTSTGYQYR